MEKLQLNKTIYGTTKAHDALDEEFLEFIPKKYNLNDLFNMYDSLFYDIIKEGKKHTHFNIVQESIRYAGEPINPKDGDIEELNSQIQQVENDIWSIENSHLYFPNGSILRSANGENDYYMQSGRRRKLNDRGAFKLIKRRAGKKNIPDEDFVIFPISSTCIAGILVGPPIDRIDDLNTDLMSINRFDERQFEEEYQ
jgi:hypothetical protein